MNRAWNNDVGPCLPPRHLAYDAARKALYDAALAAETAIAGPGCNVSQTMARLRQLRADLNAFLSPYEGED